MSENAITNSHGRALIRKQLEPCQGEEHPGTMELWSVGLAEDWSDGVMEWWSNGMMLLKPNTPILHFAYAGTNSGSIG